jgi:4'-phosphopantetheinyl transferase
VSVGNNRLKLYWLLNEAVPTWNSLDSLDFLSSSEHRRYEAMRFEKRKREWLLGRFTAKKILAECIADFNNINLSDMTVENEPEGAPYVVFAGRRLNLSLSISHRDQFAFCGLILEEGSSIGVDIEKIEPRSPVFVGDYFTEIEQQIVHETPREMRDKIITLIWSAKEAILKALGKGLRMDTNKVEIDSIKYENTEWCSFVAHSHLFNRNQFYGWWQLKDDYILTLGLLIRRHISDRHGNIQLVQVSL